MTDEKLIEKAAKAIAQEGRPGWSWDDADEWERDLARDEARAALAVFEEQQKPTEDKRKALHREATSRAETAYPALNDDDELLSYPRAALRQHKRGAYITGFTDGVARRPASPTSTGGDRMVIYANSNVTRGKFAAAAVHAALTAAGAHHGGPVIVLGAKPSEIEKHATVIRDAGRTEVEPGTVTAGTDWQQASEWAEPQAEPTDAVIEAALQALGHARSGVTPQAMRAALRAAAEEGKSQ